MRAIAQSLGRSLGGASLGQPTCNFLSHVWNGVFSFFGANFCQNFVLKNMILTYSKDFSWGKKWSKFAKGDGSRVEPILQPWVQTQWSETGETPCWPSANELDLGVPMACPVRSALVLPKNKIKIK